MTKEAKPARAREGELWALVEKLRAKAKSLQCDANAVFDWGFGSGAMWSAAELEATLRSQGEKPKEKP